MPTLAAPLTPHERGVSSLPHGGVGASRIRVQREETNPPPRAALFLWCSAPPGDRADLPEEAASERTPGSA